MYPYRSCPVRLCAVDFAFRGPPTAWPPCRLASLPPGLPATWPPCRLASSPPGLPAAWSPCRLRKTDVFARTVSKTDVFARTVGKTDVFGLLAPKTASGRACWLSRQPPTGLLAPKDDFQTASGQASWRQRRSRRPWVRSWHSQRASWRPDGLCPGFLAL